MDKNNTSVKNIQEAFGIQNLSPEEKASKGILCRLAGPCASFFDPTRNERFYDETLWDNVFNKNEIVEEMFKCGGIPMELDHPEADRDETKSLNIAAILPERPKKDENGHLVAYVDVLDTPAGRIAYTLAKYGFKWGISSRGTGDLYTDDSGNEAVDPDTYDFQTFDLVLLPAVKDARLNMTESFNKSEKARMLKVKKNLTEIYNSYNKEEKLIMKENLNKLNIKLDEALEEDVNSDSNGVIDEVDGVPVEHLYFGANGKIVDDEINESLTEAAEEADDEEIEDEDMTVADVIEDFKTLGEDKYIEFENVVLEGVEYFADVSIAEETDDTVVLKTVLTPVKQDEDIDAEDSDDEEAKDAEADETAAEDDGADEVVESMMDLVRQNKMLESKIKSLINEKTVSDAKVKELNEELNKVKAGFARTSELAAQAKEAKKINESLKADLEKKENEIVSLKNEVNSKAKMNESVNKNSENVKLLKENLTAARTELTESKKKLEEQVNDAKKRLAEKTELAKKYRDNYLNIMQKFVESKANMLGIRPAEITNRLPDKYTVEDVEKVYNSILNENRTHSALPFGKTSKISINESKASKKAKEDKAMIESGFEIADWLEEYNN